MTELLPDESPEQDVNALEYGDYISSVTAHECKHVTYGFRSVPSPKKLLIRIIRNQIIVGALVRDLVKRDWSGYERFESLLRLKRGEWSSWSANWRHNSVGEGS